MTENNREDDITRQQNAPPLSHRPPPYMGLGPRYVIYALPSYCPADQNTLSVHAGGIGYDH